MQPEAKILKNAFSYRTPPVAAFAKTLFVRGKREPFLEVDHQNNFFPFANVLLWALVTRNNGLG